jgi:hypothetical protein
MQVDHMSLQSRKGRNASMQHKMARTAHVASAALFTVIAILAIGSAAAGEAKPTPDPQLCAEYLRDLKTYHRMAEQLGCQMPPALAENAGTDTNRFPPVVTEQPTTDSPTFPPVVDEDSKTGKSSGAEQNFPPVVEQDSAPPPANLPPVQSGTSSGSKSKSTSNSGSTSGSHKKRKSTSEGSDVSEEHHGGHGRLRHEAKRAIRQLLRENGGFISNFSRSR